MYLYTKMTEMIAIQSTRSIIISESIEQMSKCQDQTYSGVFIDDETGEEGKWGMVTDGHGTNTCIRYLRSISKEKMNKVVGSKNPVETLANMVNKESFVSRYERSGATMCLVKVYKDRVVCINSGDSQACVYKNGELIFLSEEHNSKNKKEKERLAGRCHYSKSTGIEITREQKMYSLDCEYANFPGGYCIASTQALGHSGITGYAPDVTIIPYDSKDTIYVVIASDGFWDMVVTSCDEEMKSFADKTSDELLKFALERWLQEWNMCIDRESDIWVTAKYDKTDCDDVCVVKIDILPM